MRQTARSLLRVVLATGSKWTCCRAATRQSSAFGARIRAEGRRCSTSAGRRPNWRSETSADFLCGEDIAAIKSLAASTVKQYGAVPTFDKLISIGGTGSTLVSVDKAMKVYDTTRVHGAVLTRARVEEIAMKIHSVPLGEREKIVGLPPKRKDVVVGAALLMCEVMDFLGAKEITVSESDNQEGYLKFKLGQIS